MYRKIFSMLSLVLVLAVAFSAVAPVAAQPSLKSDKGGSVKESSNGVYLVEMANAPVVAYKGGIPGLKATAPKKGQKINVLSNDVVNYVAYLDGKHNEALNKVGGGQKLYDFRYSYNGFAAKLTLAQANKLAAMDGVLAVNPDELLTLDTSSTPSFLGLNTPNTGLWDLAGGVGNAGENVVVGIVDGGIWPESLSFSDRTGLNGNATKDGKLSYQQIPGWNAKCTPGEEWSATNCNQKIIGAQYYNSGWGGDAGIDAQLPWEYNSPRDFGGHGTHTASTAAGNYGVPTTGTATAFGSVSGIAPRARISVYKVCWETGDGGSCFSSDSVAAIDQAVADGVDVINFSISGSRTSFRDSVEIAFLYAADAGVFVAASAGNSGPTPSTVAHPGPWLTTVAAGTHNRGFAGASVTLGNGTTFTGTGYILSAGPLPLIDATAAGLTGADPATLALCYGAADDGVARLDPAQVAGKIVVCNRGGNVLVNKAQAVKDAGGAGMVLVNTPTSNNTIPFVAYAIPAVHLTNTAYTPIKTYAAIAGATATINAANIVYTTPAPFTASFSSRGPLQAGNGDLLKPDLMAPGQDILAAVAPPGNSGHDFDLYSGTSMSSPHVAGLGALMKDLHPDWSPMMIKSALMTTAYDVLDTGSTASKIFSQGAGHVQPNSAANPGLVFDSGFGDWLGFLCGTQLPTSFCTTAGVPVLDPSNLNVASIAIGDLAGVQTVTRKVTNVGSQAETYTASYTGLTGISVTLPGSFEVAKGATQSFSVTFTTGPTAVLNSYVGGQFTLTGNKGHVVRIPVVIRPVALAAPTQVSDDYSVTFGYAGPFTVTVRGLIPADVTTGSVDQDPDQTFDPNDTVGNMLVEVQVPVGATYARFSLFDADVAPGSDVDLYVYGPTGAPAGSSGNGGSDEEVNLVNPAPGTYYVFMHGWGLPTGTSPFKLHFWALGSTAAGNMTVIAPATATIGGTGTIDLTFSGLTPGVKYLGSVAYGGAASSTAPTIVRVDP